MNDFLLAIAVVAYISAFIVSFWRPGIAFILMTFALVPHAVSIGMRWHAAGHGPYIGLYDSLSSNLWLQALFFLAIAAYRPVARSASGIAMGICALFAAWLFFIPNDEMRLPPTYEIWWLYIHLYASKFSYSLLFVAACLAMSASKSPSIDRAVYKIMFIAFICHTLLLFSGANWAYAAWGHYWDWNALEVWSLITWLGFGLYFHVRTYQPPLWLPATKWWVAGIYVSAVLTFYGIPFISRASHQGLV